MQHANEFFLFGKANFGYELSAANRAKVLIESKAFKVSIGTPEQLATRLPRAK